MFKNQVKSAILNSSESTLYAPQTLGGIRIPEDIIRIARPVTTQQDELLLDLSQLIHDAPEAFPELATLVRARLTTNNGAASVREACERLRWDRHVSMRNALVPLIGRTLLYVYCDLIGMVQLVSRPIDDILGMRISDRKLPGDYAKRLEWCDGRPLSEPPMFRKPVPSIRPVQGDLFEVA